MKLLSEKILKAAEMILEAGTRGNADHVVVSPEYGRMLQELLAEEEFKQRLRERRLKIEKIKNGIKEN